MTQDHSYANVFPSARPLHSPSLADQAGDIDGLASLPGGSASGGQGTTVSGGRSKRKQAPAKVDPWEGSVTRCICNFMHDDGFMICCDICGYDAFLLCLTNDWPFTTGPLVLSRAVKHLSVLITLTHAINYFNCTLMR